MNRGFDPANMVLYGSGSPLAALEEVARYVRSIHLKDARRKNAEELAADNNWPALQVDLGEGEVGGSAGHFTAFFEFLKRRKLNNVPCTIEFEVFDKTCGDAAHWDAIRRQFEYVEGVLDSLVG